MENIDRKKKKTLIPIVKALIVMDTQIIKKDEIRGENNKKKIFEGNTMRINIWWDKLIPRYFLNPQNISKINDEKYKQSEFLYVAITFFDPYGLITYFTPIEERALYQLKTLETEPLKYLDELPSEAKEITASFWVKEITCELWDEYLIIQKFAKAYEKRYI
jgi:hypothetical protein